MGERSENGTVKVKHYWNGNGTITLKALKIITHKNDKKRKLNTQKIKIFCNNFGF